MKYLKSIVLILLATVGLSSCLVSGPGYGYRGGYRGGPGYGRPHGGHGGHYHGGYRGGGYRGGGGHYRR